MTDDRSLERAARSWLETGPTQAPDRAVETALLRIETTNQERDLRIPWRFSEMTTPARLAAAAVIGVLLIGGAFLYFGNPGQPAVGGPDATPSATPGVSPSSSAGSFDATSLQGWIVFGHFGKAPDGSTPAGVEYPRSIWLVHADGSGLHELAPGAPTNGKFSPDISPDGTHVVFAAWDPPFHLWEVGIDGGEPVQLQTNCDGALDGCTDAFPAYSPDGSKIAFVRGIGPLSAIAILDRASGDVSILESTKNVSPDEGPAQPSWSPDGTQIVYHQNHHDVAQDKITDSNIWIVNADGSGHHELPLADGTPYGDADWSPDGSRIVFSSWPIDEYNDGRVNVYSVRLDGSDLKALTNSRCGGCGAPSWTPDGAHILFWGPTTFWLMEPDGSDQRPINASKLTYFGDKLGYGYYGALQPTP